MKKHILKFVFLSFITLCLFAYLISIYYVKKEGNTIQNIDLNSVVNESIEEVREKPPAPVTNLSKLEFEDFDKIVELDPKLYVDKDFIFNTHSIKIISDLRDVTLCGETYKTKQAILNGVDIIQRFSEIVEKAEYCDTLLWEADKTGGLIKPGEEIRISFRYSDEVTSHYFISLGIGLTDIGSDQHPPYDFFYGLGGAVDQSFIRIGGNYYDLKKKNNEV